MIEGLGTIAKAAGIGGVAIAAIVLLFREPLKNLAMAKLTRVQSARIISLIVLVSGVVAIAGIGAWVAVEINSSASVISTTGDDSPIASDVGGDVTISGSD